MNRIKVCLSNDVGSEQGSEGKNITVREINNKVDTKNDLTREKEYFSLLSLIRSRSSSSISDPPVSPQITPHPSHPPILSRAHRELDPMKIYR